MLGARIVRDADVLPRGRGEELRFLPTGLPGGRLFVGIANTGRTPVTIRSVGVDGVLFPSLPDAPLQGSRVDRQDWWQADPAEIAPDGVGSLRIRLADVTAIGTGSNHDLEIVTDRGTISERVAVTSPDLWLPSVAFAPSLQDLVVYVANRGAKRIRLDLRSGVRVNGERVTAKAPAGFVAPGSVTPLAIHLARPLRRGQWALVQVGLGTTATLGSLRAFPADFGVSFWQVGYQPGLRNVARAAANVQTDVPGATAVADEPLAAGLSPMAVAAEVQRRRAAEPSQPTMIQLTGADEVLLYSDLADITMTHHRALEQDLSLQLSWPKPVWYLPQDAWGGEETVGAAQQWPALSDLRREALGAVGRGAKGIQWFTFWNLWQQGFGRGAAFDANREHLDLSMLGAIGNPLVMEQVGIVSGALQAVAPWLAESAPYGRRAEGGVVVDSVLDRGERMLVTAVDASAPTGPSGALPAADAPAPRFDVPIRVDVPAYLAVERAYEVDPERGIVEAPILGRGSGHVDVQVPVLDSAALLVLGRPQDGATLRARWGRVDRLPGAALRSARALEASAPPSSGSGAGSSQSAAIGPAPTWSVPADPRRARVAVANHGSVAATDVLVDLPFPRIDTIDPLSLRVVWNGAGASGPVPFRIQEPATIVDFSVPGALQGTGSPWLSTEVTPSGTWLSYAHDAARTEHDSFDFAVGGSAAVDGWVPASRRSLTLVAKGLEDTLSPDLQRLLIDVDLDGDGKPDAGVEVAIVTAPSAPAGDGARAYHFDVASLYRAQRGAALPATARWRPRIVLEAASSREPKVSRWELRSLSVGLGVAVSATVPALPPGATGALEVYYAPRGWQARPASTSRTAGEPSGVRVSVETTSFESAPVDASLADGALRVSSAVAGDRLRVDLFGADGAFREAKTVSLAGGTTGSVPLGAAGPGDTLLVSWVRGQVALTHAFRFEDVCGCRAADLRADVPSPAGPAWTRSVAEAAAGAVAAASPDGSRVAFASRARDQAGGAWRGRVTLLDGKGTVLGELDRVGDRPLGTVFAVAFDASSPLLYVAADVGATSDADYAHTQILAYRLASDGAPPSLLWQVASGAPFADQGRQVQALQPSPAGGVVYADWYGHVVALSAGGSVRWSADVGSYVNGLQPDAGGGAYLVTALQAFHIASDGSKTVVASRTDGSEFRAVAAADGVVAVADVGVRLVDAVRGVTVTASGTGWAVRTLVPLAGAHGEAGFVVGSTDGTASYQQAGAGSIWRHAWGGEAVGSVAVVAGRVYVASEEAAYSRSGGWRFRTLVRAVTPTGEVSWSAAGPWRLFTALPTALPVQGGNLVVVSGSRLTGFQLP